MLRNLILHSQGCVRAAAPVVLGLVAIACCDGSATAADPDFGGVLEAMEQRVGGTIGVYALDTGSGRELAWRADERFAMASTFKALLAAAVLAEADAGRLGLDDPVPLAGVPLVSYSPVVEQHVADGTITVAELCEAAVTLSDNTAANLLLDRVGGPGGLTRFLRHHGDETTRLDRREPDLNENAPGDSRDSSTPRAFANSLRRMLFGDALSEASRVLLRDWLLASQTGGARLRAGLPADWRVGDKTGTGRNAAVNDVAVAWAPGRDPVLIAVFMSGSTGSADALSAVHAEIAAVIAARWGAANDDDPAGPPGQPGATRRPGEDPQNASESAKTSESR